MVAHPDGSRRVAGSNLVVPTKLRPLKYQGSFLFKISNSGAAMVAHPDGSREGRWFESGRPDKIEALEVSRVFFI
jgi:hypothetical protein